jgi:hypothetical protein
MNTPLKNSECLSVTDRLPCGCVGKCDPYAHDTAWDWNGTPSRPGWIDLTPREQEQFIRDNPYCQECGDDLNAEDVEMGRRWCAECSEHRHQCEQCGSVGLPIEDTICGACAAANNEVEDAVNDVRDL